MYVAPFSSCYKKPGMLKFHNDLIEMGRRSPTFAKLNVKSIFPSNTCFLETISKMEYSKHTFFAGGGQQKFMFMAGAITCDGVTLLKSGAKHDEYIVHCFQYESPRGFCTSTWWSQKPSLFFADRSY